MCKFLNITHQLLKYHLFQPEKSHKSYRKSHNTPFQVMYICTPKYNCKYAKTTKMLYK